MTIWDIVTSEEIASYWTILSQEAEPFIGEELFGTDKKLGLDLSWIKGAKGLAVVLRPSAYDVAAIPRPRIGIERLSTQMPFFKESKYIDEEMRQELNKVLESGRQAYIDTIVKRIFDDTTELLEAARVQRERMRMMVLTSGMILVEGNGQSYEYDYQMPQTHKQNATTNWSNPEADIIGDIRKGKQKILDDTGVTVTRALTSSKVLGYMRANKAIRDSINDAVNPDRWISDSKLKQFIADELDLEIVTNDKHYRDEDGDIQRYIPEESFTMFPSGLLGTTWFGTTPEESDLMSSPNIANVSIVDTGVAITTMKKADPVQVETKVTMICMPDLPTADSIYVLSTTAA